ncbi:hypothetical protein QFC20_000481 [Naganishia adeliensis]|uniref:Uncharacterized protein n=1 Tax=Naganishia adeliensis TaxID=92952 RepID=A0ACC2X0U3_9TREE|nr:hypothetical protein QFC20_000481 [Naganishia adeliensis]
MAPGGPTRDGYELCPACIEVHGIKHTKAMSEMEPGELGTRRTVQRNVRKLGALNHTYKELLWGAKGWKEIEYHDKCKCSICQIDLYENRFKCISCPNFNLCRTSHPFLAVPDQQSKRQLQLQQPGPSRSTPPPALPYPGVNSIKHPGIFCHK